MLASLSSTVLVAGLLALSLALLASVALLARQTKILRRRNDELEVRIEALRQSEARFHAIADYTVGIEAWLNPRGKLIWVNRSIEKLTGYTPLECLVSADLGKLLVAEEDRATLRMALGRALANRSDGTIEVRFIPRTRYSLWVALHWQAIHSKDGAYLGLRVSVENIQQRKEAEAQLVHQAMRDPLTGLYNRRRFHEEIERMQADAQRRNVSFGLLMIDLDGFKPINDRLGHQAGDEVLRSFAGMMGATVRRGEMFFRLGGDEFAVLVGDATERDMAGLADRVREQMVRLSPADAEEPLTASIGIALFPQHADQADALIAAADRAMYGAKQSGRNNWQMATVD